jgi:hypothetical protein
MTFKPYIAPIAAAGLLASAMPADAASGDSAFRTGAFVGARVQMSFGGKAERRPTAALAIAPTRSRLSSDGMIRTRIGDGLALNLPPRAKPMVTLAGVRADSALGFRQSGTVDPDRKAGISTGGWIAIGAGVVVAAAVGFALWVDAVNDASD